MLKGHSDEEVKKEKHRTNTEMVAESQNPRMAKNERKDCRKHDRDGSFADDAMV